MSTFTLLNTSCWVVSTKGAIAATFATLRGCLRASRARHFGERQLGELQRGLSLLLSKALFWQAVPC